MGFKKDFGVKIVRLTSAIARKGLGHILVLSDEGEKPAKLYSDIREVETDFADAPKTIQMAKDLFNQEVDELLVAGIAEAGSFVEKLNSLQSTEDFIAVVTTSNEPATITELSTWVEGKDKLYAVTSAEKTVSNENEYVAIAYHETDNLMEKALAYMSVRPAGTVDLDGKVIKDITSSDVTEAEYNVLKQNHINVAIEKMGDLVIDGGDTAGGEKLDIILSEFWLKIQMENDLAELKKKTPKIPYTDSGISLLIDVANNNLQLALERGIVSDFEVSYVPLEDVQQADRANRVYNGVAWEARLAGAIREGTINGILTV